MTWAWTDTLPLGVASFVGNTWPGFSELPRPTFTRIPVPDRSSSSPSGHVTTSVTCRGAARRGS